METKYILILGLILATSGCVEELANSTNEEVPNKGLELESFTITDNQLRPDQNAAIIASFTNYHREIEMNEVEIFNEGVHLDISKQGCTPSIENLEGAREGIFPEMECRWTVEAPGEEALSGFRERTEPVKMRVSYNATATNQEPLEVEFRDIAEIEHTSPVSQSFSNGEVDVNMITESPVVKNSGNSIELQVSGTGPGRIEGDYSFEYTPDGVFGNCPEKDRPVVGSEWNTVCTLSADSTGVQNLFFSTHYKYIKEPNLDITLVNRR